jgi:hypothetical protein
MLEEVRARDVGKLKAELSPSMAAYTPESHLTMVIDRAFAASGSCGARVREKERPPAVTAERTLMEARLACRNGTLYMGVTFEGNETRPSSVMVGTDPTPWIAPSYVDATRFTEQRFEIPGAYLPGWSVMPKGGAKAPAVILIPAEGDADQDVTVGDAKPYADLAFGLASRGIVTARFAKRANFAPSSLPAAYDLDTDVVSDTLVAINFVSKNPAVDPKRIVLLGIGATGGLAPTIAARLTSGGVAGLAMIDVDLRRALDVRLEEIKHAPDCIEGAAGATLEARLRAAAAPGGDDAELISLERCGTMAERRPRKLWRSLLEVDAASALASQPRVPLFFARASTPRSPAADEVERKVVAARPGSMRGPTAPGPSLVVPVEPGPHPHLAPALIDALAKWVLGLPPRAG